MILKIQELTKKEGRRVKKRYNYSTGQMKATLLVMDNND